MSGIAYPIRFDPEKIKEHQEKTKETLKNITQIFDDEKKREDFYKNLGKKEEQKK